MDGIHPDFSDETLEDVGLGMRPPTEQPAAAAETWSEEPAVPAEPEVEDTAAESSAPPEESGFWNTGGARDFDWGD